MATAVKKRKATKQKKQKVFQWKGVNKQGQKVKGSMPAVGPN